jgi:hypothetical protein
MNKAKSDEILYLPELITLEDYGGDSAAYFEGVYQVFVKDFINSSPVFRGKKLRLKKYPFIAGKEYTFYHFTHDGEDELNRVPNLRRMERMPWPAPMINKSESSNLKVWRNKRGRHERILILHEEEEYLVILEDRKDYILPWTAYLIDYPNKLKRLLREYQAYKNQNRPDV